MQPAPEQTLVVPLPLPQFNDVIRAAKAHFGAYATGKKKHTSAIWWIAKAARLEPVAAPYALTFWWHPEDRRVDPDNVAHGQKYILDGLVKARVLSSDGYIAVRELRHIFCKPDPEQPRVEVILATYTQPKEAAR